MSKSKKNKRNKRSKVVNKVKQKNGDENMTKINGESITEVRCRVERQLKFIPPDALARTGIDFITEQCKALNVNRQVFDNWLEDSKYNSKVIWDEIINPQIKEEKINLITLTATMAFMDKEAFIELGESKVADPNNHLVQFLDDVLGDEFEEESNGENAIAIPDKIIKEALCTIEEAKEKLRYCDKSAEEMIESGELSIFEFNGEKMLSNAQVHTMMMHSVHIEMGKCILEYIPVPLPSTCGFSYYDLMEWLKAAGITLEQVIEWSGRYYHPDSVRELWDYIVAPIKHEAVYDAIVQYVTR